MASAAQPQQNDLNSPELYVNRELSLLEFNRRVLAQAGDEDLALLERLRFLCIASAVLDEFFEIRVAGLKQQDVYGATRRGPDNMSPAEQLRAIDDVCHALVRQQYRVLNDTLLPRLSRHSYSTGGRLEQPPAAMAEALFQPRAGAGDQPDRSGPRAPVPAAAEQEPGLHRVAGRRGRVRPQARQGDRAGAAVAAAHRRAAGDGGELAPRVRAADVDHRSPRRGAVSCVCPAVTSSG